MDPIEQLLTRGVDSIYPSRETLEKVLRSGKKLRLYQGFDPSGTQLHIGHALGLRKLRQFQDLGHEVIFLIGDFTGMIGDPSGKKDARKPLTKDQVLENAKDYESQAGKILKFDGNNPVKILFNSKWNAKLSFEEIIKLAYHFSAQQMLERDMFQERLKEGREISLVEFLYPLIVAYDAVSMNVDLEIGGTDQTFNMLAGRKLHKHILNKEKFVLTLPLLTDSNGRKIGKTEGNVIALADKANDFYGKIMSLGDDAIIPCFTLLTDTSLEEIEKTKQAIEAGENPILFKKRLAFELTKQFNTEEEAKKAQTHFENTIQKGNIGETTNEYPLIKLTHNPLSILDLLLETNLVTSKSEARRLIEQKAIELDQVVIDMVQTNVAIKAGMVIRVGKKKFLRFT